MPKYSKYLSYKEPLKLTYSSFLKKFNFNDKQIKTLNEEFIESLESYEENIRKAGNLPSDELDAIIKEQMEYVYKNTMRSILKEKFNEQRVKKMLIIQDDKDDVDLTFVDEYNSFMNSIAKRVYIPALDKKPNDKDIKEYYKKDENTLKFIRENCSYADDVINAHIKKGTFKASELRNNTYETIDRINNGSIIDNKQKLLANYIAMKKEYNSHNPFYNFFLGGRTRIAMRAAENAIKNNFMVNKNEDVFKFAKENVGPSDDLYKLIESANPNNKAIYNKNYDILLESKKILMEVDNKNKSDIINKNVNDDYLKYKEETFKKIRSIYENGSKVDVNKLNGESYRAYYDYVNMFNADQNKAINNEKQRQFNELKNALETVATKINIANTEKIIDAKALTKGINSRHAMFDKLSELCEKYNIENKYKNIIDDQKIQDFENKKLEIEVPEYDPNVDLDEKKNGKIVALDKNVNNLIKEMELNKENDSPNRMNILVSEVKEKVEDHHKGDIVVDNSISNDDLNRSGVSVEAEDKKPASKTK